MPKDYKVKTLKNGEKRYIFDVSLGYKSDGTRIRTTVISKTIEEGRIKVSNLRVKNKKISSNKSLLFKEAYALYLEDCRDCKMAETTLYNKETIYYKDLTQFLDTKLSKIKESDVVFWKNNLKKHLKDTTVGTRESNLRSFFNWCVRKKLIDSSPFDDVTRTSSKSDSEIVFWTEDEFKEFINYVTYDEHKLIFTTLFYTGLRKSELFGLKYSDVIGNELHLSETVKRTGSKYIIGQNFKNKNSKRIVPKPSWLDFGEGEGYIFSPKIYSHINRDLDIWIKKAGVKRITIHGIRHSYVAMLIAKGVNIYTISKMVGHESIKTTLDTYGHLYPNEREEIIKLFD
jgi:integrase|uniref:Integrase n=1 Tax=Siphoviridae sp. ctGuJ10 TaxID=2825418 RepID=A0A8S5PTQ2_9CAUD|nr:MAG TPA: Integrase [Siphoviridae sp. ctGuJ10]